eukprot:TRINITY_DN14513_c0_g1_i2.p1 TRINITY_DN14513_c0_g1~~TRINITY_DN14513_c0_g1_i2.p1  ORF type:complete len:602 (-),score=109.46 TRINITY_DN14513_c0_g1_i2:187-1992(-)
MPFGAHSAFDKQTKVLYVRGLTIAGYLVLGFYAALLRKRIDPHAIWEKICSALRFTKEDRPEQAEIMQRKARTLSRQYRLQGVRITVSWLTHLAVLSIVTMEGRNLMWGVWTDTNSIGNRDMNTLQLETFLLAVVCIFFEFAPKQLTLLRIDIVNVAAHALLALQLFQNVYQVNGVYTLIWQRPLVGVIRFGTTVCCGHARLSSILNAALSITSCITFTVIFPEIDPVHEEYFGNDLPMWYCLHELFVSVLIFTMTYSQEGRQLAEAMAVLEKIGSSKGYSAACSLLNSVCDVVVEVDGDLNIAEPAQRLACTLLHGDNRSLQGTRLSEYLASDSDTQRVVEALNPATCDRDVGKAFHVCLRDALGTTMSVEMFSIPFEGVDDLPRYLLGIREFSDVAALPPPPRLPEATLVTDPPQSGANTPGTMEGCQTDGYTNWRNKRHKAICSKGTGPMTQPQDLRSHSSSSSSNSSGSKGNPNSNLNDNSPLVLSSRSPTHIAAKETTLLCTLMRWNFRRPAGLCCGYHSAVLDLGVVAQRLAQGPCQHNFKPTDDWQCHYCGLLYGTEEEDCEVCPDDVAEKRGLNTTRGRVPKPDNEDVPRMSL